MAQLCPEATPAQVDTLCEEAGSPERLMRYFLWRWRQDRTIHFEFGILAAQVFSDCQTHELRGLSRFQLWEQEQAQTQTKPR